MNAIKAYLLRLICCGFLVSLAGALLKGKRSGRILRLCGGCLMILTALNPLLRVDLAGLPDLITGLSPAQRMEEAREKNRELLRRMVTEQTERWILDRAAELGMEPELRVQTREEEGVFVPDGVLLRGSWTDAQRAALSAILSGELGIGPERQRWEEG